MVRFYYKTTDADVYLEDDDGKERLIGRVLERPPTMYGEPGPFFDWFDRAGGKGAERTLKAALQALKSRYE